MLSRKWGGNSEEAGILSRLEKDGYLSETALCVSWRYPQKDDKGGGRGGSPSRIGSPRKERAKDRKLTLRPPKARPHRRMGNGSWWRKKGKGIKKERKKKKKGFLCLLRRTPKRRGSCQGALRLPERAMLSGCRRRTVSPTPRSWKPWRPRWAPKMWKVAFFFLPPFLMVSHDPWS